MALGMTADNAERAILGAMIRSPTIIRPVAEVLATNDFMASAHREIYEAIKFCFRAGRAIDIITLDDELTHRGKLELVGGAGYLVELTSGVSVAANWRAYADIIKEHAERAQLRQIAAWLMENSTNGAMDVSDIVNATRDALKGAYRVSGEWVSNSTVMMDALEQTERMSSGEIQPIASGVSGLDDITGGFFPGELVILAARPSVGKTAFALSIAQNAALHGFSVGFVSAEMISEQVGIRMFATANNVDGQKLRRPKGKMSEEDWTAMAQALNDYANMPISWLFQREAESILAQIRNLHDEKKCDIAIIDYAQLLTTRKAFKGEGAERLKIDYIVKEFVTMSKELRIPVILLAQVNRMGDTPKPPRLADLKGSGGLEENADMVVMIHRIDSADDEMLGKENDGLWLATANAGNKLIGFVVAKNRQGSTGKALSVFSPNKMIYASV